MGNAPGIVAIAICDRCKFKFQYRELMADGDSPGLRVCRECRDVRDPYRLPRPPEKPITMKYPRPDVHLNPGPGYLITEDGNFVVTQDSGFIESSPD